MKNKLEWIERQGLINDFNDFCINSADAPIIWLVERYYTLKNGFSGFLSGKELATI